MENHYATLGIPFGATVEEIKKSYYRLARLYHPDKNLGKHDTTAAFQQLQAAYETLSDPDKRCSYDRHYSTTEFKHKFTEPDAFSEGSESSQSSTAQQEARDHLSSRIRKEHIFKLNEERKKAERDIFEYTRRIRQLETELTNLKEIDAKERMEKAREGGFWSYMPSSIFGSPKSTKDEQHRWEVESLQRAATTRIKSNDLESCRSTKHKLEDELGVILNRINLAEKNDEEKSRREQQTHEHAQRAEELRKARERAESLRKAQEAANTERLRKAREAANAERLRRAASAAKAAEEASREEAAARERAAAKQQYDARRKRFTEQSNHRTSPNFTTPEASNVFSSCAHEVSQDTKCEHYGFWPKIEGCQQCEVCGKFLKHFAFECPRCELVACAGCRRTIQCERMK